MRIGQTSIVVFVSKVLGSAIGFVTTIYFARVLGAEIFGIYSLVLVTAIWFKLVGDLGVGSAITKRLSEGEERASYLGAGMLTIVAFAFGITVVLLLGRSYLATYIDGFESYSEVAVVWYVVLFVVVQLLASTIDETLKGEHKVHIAGFLEPLRVGLRGGIQALLVFLGFGLVGLLLGYAAGTFLVVIVGALFVSIRPRRPDLEHVRSLFDYAKFSWLGNLKSRTYRDVDILILGLLVPSSLVGVYAVAWSLTRFLDIFGNAIRQTVFPEISSVSAREDPQAAGGLIEDSLAFTGFITIPGFVGGTLLADRLMRIYGPEFLQGTQVLWLLLLSILVYGFAQQCQIGLNAVDRPDVAFRVNAVFVVTNVVLNVVLIRQLGWIGAAIASAFSASLAFVLAYWLLLTLVTFDFPVGEFGRQSGAALVMGGTVWLLDFAIETTGMLQHNFATLCILVSVGAGLYFGVLFAISTHFRRTIDRNLPDYLPRLS